METNEVKIARLEEQMGAMIRSFDDLRNYIKQRDEDFKKFFMAEINNSTGSLRSDVNQANSRSIENKSVLSKHTLQIADVENISNANAKKVEAMYEAYQSGIFIGRLTKGAWAVFVAIISAASVLANIVFKLLSN